MPKKITLDDFNGAIDEKYTSLEFELEDGEVVELRPYLRLSTIQRAALDEINPVENKEMGKLPLNEYAERVLEIVAGKKGYEKLAEKFGEERAHWELLWLMWTGREDLGEA